MIREVLFSHRNGPCCRCGEKEYSWDELHGKSTQIAAYLLKTESKVVLLYGKKSFLYLCCIAGCVLAGIPYIAVTHPTPEERVRSMLMQSVASLILDLCPQHRWESMPEGVSVVPVSEALEVGEHLETLPQISVQSTAYILFTSGSTGKPKGVQVTYANLENFLDWFTSLPVLSDIAPETVLNEAEFSFDLSVADVYYTFLRGGCIALTGTSETSRADSDISELIHSKAELAVMTPSHAELCLLDDRFSAEYLQKLFCFFFCGEVLHPATVRRLWKRFPHARILNAYGPTEATCAVSAVEITREIAEQDDLPIGEMKQDAVSILLVDENGCEVPQGSTGRILLAGKSVAAGYLGEESGFCKRGEFWAFLTGDLGYVRNGFLWYGGRVDNQIKYKGYRLEPGEIECVLCEVTGILQAAVIPRRAPDGRVIALEAHISCESGITEDCLLRELSQKLPAYMVPRRIIFHDMLPLTVNGKIDRRRIEEC